MRGMLYVACAAVLAVGPVFAANDFDPATATPTGGWAAQADHMLQRADATNKLRITMTKAVYCNAALLDHNKASDGTKYSHVHFQADYAGGEVAEGNRYFDWLFGASDSPAKTTRTGDCTDKTNCHAYALTTFIGTGTWPYFIQPSSGPYSKETDPKDKTDVRANDVLWYGDAHSTGVKAVSAPGAISKLAWKAGNSGIYEMDTTAFDTPKKKPGSGLTKDEELPTDWTWDASALAKEANLEGGKVRRKK